MFKVGDWVKTNKGVFQIESIDNHDFIEQVEDDIQLYFTDKNERWDWSKNCELWQPEVCDWCWISNRLGKLIDDYTVCFSDGTRSVSSKPIVTFSNIEPFIGQLPNFIKEIKNV
jgi:hypothetical protein